MRVGLVGFHGISTLEDYLIPNPVYTLIKLVNELFVGNTLNKPEFICLHTVKWFQVLISNNNNSTL